MNVDAVQAEADAGTAGVLRRLFTRDLVRIPVIVLVIIVGSFVSPGFLIPENLMNALQQSSELWILGALSGVILLGLLQNVLTLSQVAAFWIDAAYGAIILFALIVTRLTSEASRDN